MPNGTYGGVRGRKMKVGRKLSFSSYSICQYTNCSSFVIRKKSVSLTNKVVTVPYCSFITYELKLRRIEQTKMKSFQLYFIQLSQILELLSNRKLVPEAFLLLSFGLLYHIIGLFF